MRTKISQLEDAFTGHFDDHHAFLPARMLARIEGIDADIAALDEQIEVQLAPFAVAAERLDEIPGIGPVAAAVILAEIGADMSRFPTAGHLCSWAKFSPGINSSAGKTKGNGSTGHGNRYLARVLGEYSLLRGPCVVRVSAGVRAHDLRWSAPVLVWLSATCKAPSTA
jgi:transposase